MKKSLILLTLILLITINLALANNNIYQEDSLHLQLDVNGNFELVPEGGNSKVREVTAELFLFPQDDFRQKVLEISNLGTVEEDKVIYEWNDEKIEKKEFGYSAFIETRNERKKVQTKVLFPPTNIKGYEQYTLPTKKIDSNNQAVAQKAAELAEGETDLFKVVFKLANWVSENIEYNLNDLTTDVAQPASWVLQNKQGVCDEMTSLFVAMARSLGIPARFVSGISYTEDQAVVNALGTNWAGHGWGEIYFPDVGWVSFDIAFDEYGYIDVTHIKLRESYDPDEPATKYSWLAEKVKITTEPLDLDVKIKRQGVVVPEEILLEEEVLAPEVTFGSYNLVKGVLKNTADYYVATTLRLAVPKEITILGENRRTILLSPKEVRETFWIIQISENLNENYVYQFPLLIYSEKNVSVQEEMSAQQGKSFYSKKEIDELTVKDEEKSYSRKVSFECDYPTELEQGDETKIKCAIKNSGNTNLKDINFCLDDICEPVDLPINQEKETEIKIRADEIGWNKVFVSAENDFIEKKTALSFVVFDEPDIETGVTAPQTVDYGDAIQFSFDLNKTSFNIPQEIIVLLQGKGIENRWDIETLQQQQRLEIELENLHISKNNKFVLVTKWQDNKGKVFSQKQEILVEGKAKNFIEKIKMMINGIINSFL